MPLALEIGMRPAPGLKSWAIIAWSVRDRNRKASFSYMVRSPLCIQLAVGFAPTVVVRTALLDTVVDQIWWAT